jgi:hypothetical protein
LDGKYAVSADDAAERAKAEELKKTKAKLDAIQQRENAVILELNDIKVLPLELTRENVPSHKRVVRVSDVVGPGQVIFTSDLSKLERVVDTATTTVGNAINPLAKSFPDDAENDVDETAAAQTTDGSSTKRSVYGLIKLMVERCENVEIIVQCKLISGTIEVHQCENVTVVVQDPTVTTLQVDLSNNCAIRFEGGISGCWDALHTRILHAGCQHMHVSIVDGSKKVVSEVTADYLTDGAVAIGNAKPTEFQFITSMPLKDSTQLITEAVAKSGVKAMTKRELEESQRNRNKALARATEMAEGMVQIKDKDGNPLVAKTMTSATTTSATTTTTTATTASTTTTLLQTDEEIMAECEAFKVQGNASFAAGEYAQSLLYYSLAIDKAAALGNQQDATLSKAATLPKFPVDVLYANRAAACLKLGQHERALADADLALAINPDNLKATFRKGLALHAGGQYYTALPILAAAHKREPSNKQIKQALQFCEVRVEQDQRKRMTMS